MGIFATHAPTRIRKRSDHVDYVADLLDRIRLRNVRVADAAREGSSVFYLRHDVDHDLTRALQMARIESRHGYKATYFLLTPAAYEKQPRNYYGYLENGRIVHDSMLADHCKELLDLGHDIGFHNDLVALSLKTGLAPRALLELEVDFFSSHGIPLRGTAAHGNPLCRALAFNNRELFEGCVRKGWEPGRVVEYQGHRVQLHSLRMADYGFAYEAYSLPRDSRISDSGGRWAGRIAGELLPKQRLADQFDLQEFHRIVDRSCSGNGIAALSVLTHPCHWDSQ